ncbi:MAG: hypothetical protein WC554_16015 [Clostridia bacterium]
MKKEANKTAEKPEVNMEALIATGQSALTACVNGLASMEAFCATMKMSGLSAAEKRAAWKQITDVYKKVTGFAKLPAAEKKAVENRINYARVKAGIPSRPHKAYVNPAGTEPTDRELTAIETENTTDTLDERVSALKVVKTAIDDLLEKLPEYTIADIFGMVKTVIESKAAAELIRKKGKKAA